MGGNSWHGVGEAIGAIERRYDGPVPAAVRRQALAGGPAALARRDAIARSACFDRLARCAVAAAARRRRQTLAAGRDDGTHAEAAADLARCRAAGLFWHDAAGA